MPRRFQQGTFQRTARPNRSWFRVVTTTVQVVAANTKVLLATGVLDNQGIDETILRTVGVLSIFTDNAGASEQQIGAFGIVVVTDLAAAAGAASIPGPITDGGDDGWQTYVPIAQAFRFETATGVRNISVNYPFDSKAKRVVSTGQSIAFMIENAHATFGFNAMLTMRMLSQVRGTR